MEISISHVRVRAGSGLVEVLQRNCESSDFQIRCDETRNPSFVDGFTNPLLRSEKIRGQVLKAVFTVYWFIWLLFVRFVTKNNLGLIT